jgi:hypothetical protein
MFNPYWCAYPITSHKILHVLNKNSFIKTSVKVWISRSTRCGSTCTCLQRTLNFKLWKCTFKKKHKQHKNMPRQDNKLFIHQLSKEIILVIMKTNDPSSHPHNFFVDPNNQKYQNG